MQGTGGSGFDERLQGPESEKMRVTATPAKLFIVGAPPRTRAKGLKNPVSGFQLRSRAGKEGLINRPA